MDNMLGEYSVKQQALRWPLAFFDNMIDVAGVACHVIYREHNARFREKDQRRKFLKELANILCMPSMEARSRAIPRQVIQGSSPTLSDFDEIRQSDKTSLSDFKKLIFFLIGQLEIKIGCFCDH